eukprot:1141928-Pelagomonas_calceolata.AAC.1
MEDVLNSSSWGRLTSATSYEEERLWGGGLCREMDLWMKFKSSLNIFPSRFIRWSLLEWKLINWQARMQMLSRRLMCR